MPAITFCNKRYVFDNGKFNLQYFDSGDLHGNDNFRTQVQTLYVYEVLQQIDTTLLESALAVTIDGKLMSLATKLEKDCNLDIVTLNTTDGKTIYHYSLAFLIAQTMYSLDHNVQLKAVSVSNLKCSLQFNLNSVSSNIANLIEKQLSYIINDNTALQTVNAFQKELLVETYPSLSQSYSKSFLEQYDNYDFITIAIRNHFALPVPENTVLVTTPKHITNYSLSHSIKESTYTITAQLTNHTAL